MKLITTLFIILVSLVNANDIYKSSTKTSCIQQSEHAGKSLDQQKKILIEQAKQESLEELYGTLIFSKTDLKNGKMTSNEIKSRAIGSVRVNGNPKFFNGKNFGEICSDVTSYVTRKDIEKYSPKEITLKRFCYNNPNEKINSIKTNANYKAYKQVIAQYKPSFKNISDKQAEKLIHGFIKSNEDMSNIGLGLYCFDAVATILPYEFDMTKVAKSTYNSIESIDENNIISGMIATFYKSNDYKLKNPIYKTYVHNLDLAYTKLPYSHIIQPNTPYWIKIEGYYKSSMTQNKSLRLFADTYSAELFIDNKKVLTHQPSIKRGVEKNVRFKRGFNKIKLLIKTANGYDVKVQGDLNDLYTHKIQN